MKNMNIVSLILFIGLFSTSVIGQYTDIEDTPAEDVNECNCTPFHSCKSYVPADDGGELIDVRVNIQECSSYMDICCNDTIINHVDNNGLSSTDGTSSSIDETSNSAEGASSSTEGTSTTQEYEIITPSSVAHISSTDATNEETVCVCDTTTSLVDSKVNIQTTSIDNQITSENPILKQENSETPVTDTSSGDHDGTNEKCGAWNRDGVGFRVINAVDDEAQYAEYPSMIALFMEEETENDEKKLSYFCGGSLIRKNVILTAAHCVYDKKESKPMIARAGEWDLKTEKENFPHQDQRVSKYVTHSKFYKGALHNDIALVFLESPFTLQENIQTICLPKQDDSFTDVPCYASGWGKTVSLNNFTIEKKTKTGSHKQISQYEINILKKVQLPIISREKCMDALRGTRLGPKFILHDSFICAGGEEGKDTCRGDGGSPLMCPSKEDENVLVQAGIVAWGISCGIAGIPAAYVNVAGFRDWIDQEIEKYYI